MIQENFQLLIIEKLRVQELKFHLLNKGTKINLISGYQKI